MGKRQLEFDVVESALKSVKQPAKTELFAIAQTKSANMRLVPAEFYACI